MPEDKLDSRKVGTRRDFLTRALGAASTLATVGAALPATVPTCPADAPADGVAQSGAPLQTIGEVRRGGDGILRATLMVEDENRSLWMGLPNTLDKEKFNLPVCRENYRMRYFAGGPTGGARVWPVAKGVPAPGPTLRARVGDHVQITLLNHVDLKNFPDTLDLAEQGKSDGCDVSNTLAGEPGKHQRQEIYPSGDAGPNCFRGSSGANLHFHGFHVSPNGVGDDVMIEVRPSPRDPRTNQPLVTEMSVRQSFQEIFTMCHRGHPPAKWEDLPKAYRDLQERLLKAYDRQVPAAHLWEANEMAIKAGEWPQFAVGAYPNGFHITEHGKPPMPGMPPAKMGQSPGTHWYHAHKHGSTALNSFNGMAGVFIVEGDYDDQLQAFYKRTGLEEKVLILQQYAPQLNLLTAPTPNGSLQFSQQAQMVFVNGQLNPVVTMHPGQIQLWRILNAGASLAIVLARIEPSAGQAETFAWRQTAQDGVQYCWDNFNSPANVNPRVLLSPANRADLLLQAPSTPGVYELRVNTIPGPTPEALLTLLTIKVEGAAVQPGAGFPSTQAEFPAFPEFLKDIDPRAIRLRREVTFNTERFGPQGERNAGGIGRGDYPRSAPSRHTIDGMQFRNNIINHVMLLDSEEEWTLINLSQIVSLPPDANGVATPFLVLPHPFHIHINPFQVVEIFDPLTMKNPRVFEKDYPWHDTIGIPAAYDLMPDRKTPRLDKNGKRTFVPGYVKIRHRFVDFTGTYVFHCHILAHEDRGMMNLVQVVSNRTMMQHYH
jgi:FtsP/CotA-like multicopper oxidase with cupredoxin domain